jgi:hypothetical protein
MPETKTVTCILTPAEMVARGAELSRSVFDWEAAEEEKKRVTKEIGDRIKELEANMKRLSRVVKSGKEEREVEVKWIAAIESETMRLIRCDTGEELTSRPMTKEEKEFYRQAPLPLPQPLALPAAGPIVTPEPAPALLIENKNGDAIEGEFEVLK